jgi:hypothetical protein
MSKVFTRISKLVRFLAFDGSCPAILAGLPGILTQLSSGNRFSNAIYREKCSPLADVARDCRQPIAC